MATTLKSYLFCVTLAGVSEFDDAMTDALFEAGCADAGVGSCEDVVTVDFQREADSPGDAIGSAVKDVKRAGYAVAEVDVESEPTETEKNAVDPRETVTTK